MKLLPIAVVVCVVVVAFADNFDCGPTKCLTHVQSSRYIVYPVAGGRPRIAAAEDIRPDESCQFCYANLTKKVGYLVVAVDSAINNADGETVRGILYHNGEWDSEANIQPYTGTDDGEWMGKLVVTGGYWLQPKNTRNASPLVPYNNKVLVPSEDDKLILADRCKSENEWHVFQDTRPV